MSLAENVTALPQPLGGNWTVPTYGGRRWWFLCPRTSRKSTKLYLPNGGWHFWSRQAYGLGYACQRDDRFSRLLKLTRFGGRFVA
jgi:hypothetical protein